LLAKKKEKKLVAGIPKMYGATSFFFVKVFGEGGFGQQAKRNSPKPLTRAHTDEFLF
jgi:hypothetical protein